MYITINWQPFGTWKSTEIISPVVFTRDGSVSMRFLVSFGRSCVASTLNVKQTKLKKIVNRTQLECQLNGVMLTYCGIKWLRPGRQWSVGSFSVCASPPKIYYWHSAEDEGERERNINIQIVNILELCHQTFGIFSIRILL